MNASQDDKQEKYRNALYTVLFGSAIGGIIALFCCTLILMGKYLGMNSSIELPRQPPFLLFFLIFVLMSAGGALVAHQRLKRKKASSHVVSEKEEKAREE